MKEQRGRRKSHPSADMRTLEKPSRSPSARTATAAGTIAQQTRLQAVPVILSDFERIGLTSPREQDELKRIQAHFMSIAQCAARGIVAPEERAQVARLLQDRMARYGASSEHI